MSIMGASVSGMTADSSWLSSISQNVSNANTTGYKSANVEFSALVDEQSISSYDASGVTTSIENMNSVQGGINSAPATTDLAINGPGYFVVTNGSGDTLLTRDGSFVPDKNGNLINADGNYLMGYNVLAGNTSTVSNSSGSTQMVNVDNAGVQAVGTTSGTLTANLPATAAVVTGNTPVSNAANSTYTEETSLSAYNSLGGTQTINLYMTKTGANQWEVTAYDATTAAAGGGFPYTAGNLGTATLTFNPNNGQLVSGSPVSIQVPNGQVMSLNLTGTTQLDSPYSVSAATTNGNAPGSVSGVTINESGELSFTYTNGTTVLGYQIPLASVPSPDNLTLESGNAYQTNLQSGAALYGTPGTAGLGTIKSSSLEGSTVDLATELTEMIQAQSSYQANSKVFQTGADLLDILNNLKA